MIALLTTAVNGKPLPGSQFHPVLYEGSDLRVVVRNGVVPLRRAAIDGHSGSKNRLNPFERLGQLGLSRIHNQYRRIAIADPVRQLSENPLATTSSRAFS